VIKWVVDYFTPKQTIDKPTNVFESLTNSPVMITNKMPLILQHDGHSRTIIGYEIDSRGITNLLMFDPA
jgi:Peptidase family C78